MDLETEQINDWWRYDQLESIVPADWTPAVRGENPWDALDFHIDIGSGTVPKARLGIDHRLHPTVDVAIDLETGEPIKFVEGRDDPDMEEVAKRSYELAELHGGEGRTLPFPDESIESIITHHCFEHIDRNFIPLMDDCHRVLKPGGILRIIVPCFPSQSAVCDPDHRRYFMPGVWQTFCGGPDGSHWMESFSVPYTSCRFQLMEEDYTAQSPPEVMWTPEDAREMRVTLRKWPR